MRSTTSGRQPNADMTVTGSSKIQENTKKTAEVGLALSPARVPGIVIRQFGVNRQNISALDESDNHFHQEFIVWPKDSIRKLTQPGRF